MLANALRRARTLYKCPLVDLVKETEASASQLALVESGQVPATEPILRAYAKRFRVDFEELDRLRG